MYRTKDGEKAEGIDLDTPLMYADRFRIRRPGIQWDAHPPHVDGRLLALQSALQLMTFYLTTKVEASSVGRTKRSVPASTTS